MPRTASVGLESRHVRASKPELSPNDPAIGCEDAFDERSAIMSAKCTGRMDFITQTREKNLS
jgi:hypothetical protein